MSVYRLGAVFMVFASVLFGGVHTVLADALPHPQGKVILTVEGNITRSTDGNRALLDRSALEALGMHTLETTNPFVKGVHRYEGVLLSDVLKFVGAHGGVITARALDGYTIDIPVEDIHKYPVLLAMKADGKTMSVRRKGPLWVIYPVDQYAELNSEAYSSRSIWQLTQLTVK